MPSSDFILWCDLETTGNGPVNRTEILEVGLILTSQDLDPIAAGAWLVSPPDLNVNDWSTEVIEMHAKSGLIRALRQVTNSATIIEDDIIRWLDEHTKNETQHIPFAGSGVGHFDRKYIDYWMPRFSKRLTYWPLDIGVSRRNWEYLSGTGQPWPFRHALEMKTHRALDDTWAALIEAYMFRNHLRTVQGYEPTEMVIPDGLFAPAFPET